MDNTDAPDQHVDNHPMSDQWVGGYHLLQRIGQGGSGTVWEAADEAGNHFALKLIHPALASDENARARLLREVRLVNQIDSPSVAHVHDVETEASVPFVVTDLIRGPTLAEETARSPLSPTQAAEFGQQLAAVLEAVHSAGVVHRDLKPSNVIVTPDGPVLIDFGIAHAEGLTLTEESARTGTAGFMDPNLLASPNSDSGSDLARLRSADWFGWSACLLQTVTGRPPFGSGDALTIINRAATGECDVAGLPAGLQTSFRQALAPRPAERPGPAALLSALRHPGPAGTPTVVISSNSATSTMLAPAPPAPFPPPPPAALLSAGLTAQEPHTLTRRPTRLGVRGSLLTGLLLVALSALPAFAGPQWLLVAAAFLLAAQVAGRMRWRRQRRSLAVTVLHSPWDLVVAALSFLPALVVLAAAFLGGVWVGIGLTFQWLDPRIVAQWALAVSEGPTSLAPAPLIVWGSAFLASLLALLLPTSRAARAGLQAIFGRRP